MNSVNASEALERLQAGNRRYCSDQIEHPHDNASRHRDLSGGQEPFACILSCSDSRVPLELIFDQGLGELFVVRVAGHVCNDAVLGSLEYAALVLGVRLFVVMGHQNCGAVGATVERLDANGPAMHNHIDALIESIRPSVPATGDTHDLLDRSIRAHAIHVADAVRHSRPVFSSLADEGVRVVAAYYDLVSGEVDWLERENPAR